MEAQKSKKSFSTTKSYFKFNFKYLLKRKSTWLSPLIFFVFFLLMSTFLRLVFGAKNNTLAMLQTMVSLFSIIFFAIIGITKGINLFREPSTEGVEILIVSKPLTRRQILVVKFTMFNLYGLILFLFNLVVFLICAAILNIPANQYSIIGVGAPITNWFSYLFFGTLAILLSTKFSSKLVMGVGITGVVLLNTIGGVFNNFVPVFLTGKAQSMDEELRKTNSVEKYQNPGPKLFFNDVNSPNSKRFLLAKNAQQFNSNSSLDGTTTRSMKFENLYQEEFSKNLENIWNQGKDSLWINQLQIFLNPTSSFSKIGYFSSEQKNSNSLFSLSAINEKDFSWSAKVVENFSAWNEGKTNYSLYGTDLSDLTGYTSSDIGSWSQEKNVLKELGAYGPGYYPLISFTKGFKLDETSAVSNLTHEYINSIKDKILNLVDTKLATVTGSNDEDKKKDAISKIKTAIQTSSDFNQAFFDQFVNWNYVDTTGSNLTTEPGSKWTKDEDKKAEFIYYLAQIVVVNQYFDQHDNPTLLAQARNNAFKAEMTKVQDFDNDQTGQNTKFFGDNFKTKIVKSSKLKMIELVATERTPAWSLAILWLAVVLLLNAGTIFLFFRKDFK